jgi:hypothetical protein
MKNIRDRRVDDPQQSVSALQKEIRRLQEENATLIFEKRELIFDLKQSKINFTNDLKQSKLNLTKCEIKYEKMKTKFTEKIKELEAENIRIKKSRPTVAELMSKIGRRIAPEE